MLTQQLNGQVKKSIRVSIDRLVKGGGVSEENVRELRKVVEELHHRENWKKYGRMIPKVIQYFRKCETIAEDVSKRHDVHVEFLISGDRCGVHAIVNTEDMSKDQKLKAIMSASVALKDFYDRLRSEA